MPRKAYRKSTIFIVLIAVSIGLITLGMRLPPLSGLSSASGKPKPRPRAIIQQQVKTCKETVSPASPLVATVATVEYLLLESVADVTSPSPPTSTIFVAQTQQPSRAPPV